MTTPTIHGAEHDLLVIREIRERILAGDWSANGPRDRLEHKCLLMHLLDVDNVTPTAVYEHVDRAIGLYNDTHTQAEIVALLDDVEDSLLGELGVVG